jgi:hypothetical protein
MKRVFRLGCLGVLIACAFAFPLPADTVRLTNGDTVHGKVLTLDDKGLTLESGPLGKLTIDRKNVEVIVLGDAPLPAAAAPGPAPNAVNDYLKSQKIDPAVFRQGMPGAPAPADAPQISEGTPADAIRQLQTQGLDPQMVRQLQQTLPLMATPEAKKYFNDTLAGLASGKLNVEDIRKDAVHARDELLSLEKDLGPAGHAAIAPYLGILNHFLDESAPPEEKAANEKAPVNPPSAKPKR